MDKAKPKQALPNKLSSTDRSDMLSTIYRRTRCAAKTPISRSISKNENANSSNSQISPSESGLIKRNQPVAITPISGSLSKNKNANGGFYDSGSCSSSKSRRQNEPVEGANLSPNQAKTLIPRSISKNDNGNSSIGKIKRQSSPGRRATIPSIYKRTQPVAIAQIPGSLPKNENASGGFTDSGSCSSSKSREQTNPVEGATLSPNQGSCPTNQNNRKRKSPYIVSGSLGYPQNGPTSDIIWKGTFEVLNLSHEMGLCEGFVARPSAKVSEKAYKFTKQIAGALKFKLEPRSELWPKIFQIRSPDWDDVALYFYPGKSERSVKKYSDLLKYMEKNDLVLRILMGLGHVELLVFSSKTLALDCRLLKHNYFMWGVFRALKCEAITRDILPKYT